jgi:biopolymer transport protein ExbD
MKFNPTRRRRAEINVIPLIDILCMLLIFFIVTTTFKKKTASVDVTPPKSEKGTEKTEEPQKAPPELTLKSAKAAEYAKLFEVDTFPLYLGGQTLNLNPKSDSFRADLARTLKEKGVKNIVLNFDETTPISIFFKFFDACEDAGVPISVRTSKIGGATATP